MHKLILPLLVSSIFYTCSNKQLEVSPASAPIDSWTTSGDGSALLKHTTLDFVPGKNDSFPVITIDSTQSFQTIDGFGYTLTGGSAQLIHQLGAATKDALLEELFGTADNSIGVSYLRISMGASDLSPSVFSYNDLPSGETDVSLSTFSLSQDTLALLPVLQQILKINPNIKIMATPWSAPVWMKNNGSSIGGSLQPQCYGVYAQYFVKYIQQMQAQGIPIDAVTLQNEPEHGGNNPSMLLTAPQAIDFVKNHLGPAFQTAGLSTKIIVWDHNCDHPEYPITVLNDPAAKAYIHGSAFHLYGGDISALSQVHEAHPDKALYFTEQYTGANGNFGGDLNWHLKNVIIGSMRNYSRTALEWNLANDASYGPHTPGGCTECKGALTIQDGNISRNVSYYIVAQVSKFVPPGSVRIASNTVDGLQNVAFKTPDGKTVLVVLNEGNELAPFTINHHSAWITTSLPAQSVGTFVW